MYNNNRSGTISSAGHVTVEFRSYFYEGTVLCTSAELSSASANRYWVVRTKLNSIHSEGGVLIVFQSDLLILVLKQVFHLLQLSIHIHPPLANLSESICHLIDGPVHKCRGHTIYFYCPATGVYCSSYSKALSPKKYYVLHTVIQLPFLFARRIQNIFTDGHEDKKVYVGIRTRYTIYVSVTFLFFCLLSCEMQTVLK